jgi:hypothetical protein
LNKELSWRSNRLGDDYALCALKNTESICAYNLQLYMDRFEQAIQLLLPVSIDVRFLTRAQQRSSGLLIVASGLQTTANAATEACVYPPRCVCHPLPLD